MHAVLSLHVPRALPQREGEREKACEKRERGFTCVVLSPKEVCPCASVVAGERPALEVSCGEIKGENVRVCVFVCVTDDKERVE